MDENLLTKEELDEMVELSMADGFSHGSPMDQVERLVLVSHYSPYPWQWAFHAAAREADHEGGPVDIGLGGARGPGKSHAVLSQAALDDCQRCPGLKILFLRQTGVSAQESFDDLITKAVRGRAEYHKTKNALKFPNGSRVLLGGFKDEGDIDKYIGIEYDVIIVEELTQLTKEKYDKLRGSLRTSKPNWRPRMYTSFNPGGIGHAWVRDRYVVPFRRGQQTDTRFIPSNYKDNPMLNAGYIEYLESLGGALGRAWREGNWDVFEGQYFYEWDHERHVVAPFKIPITWLKYRSVDPSGRAGVTSCHWYAVNTEGRAYCYREYFKTGKDLDEHAKAIARLSQDDDGVVEEYQYTVIDAAAFSKAGYSETAAEIFERNGVVGLLPAAKERVVGWNAVHTYLRWTKTEQGYTQPLIQFFSTCANMIETIPLALHDERHPEDVMSINTRFTDAEDNTGNEHQDALDDLRYFLRTLRETKAPRAETPVERRLSALREKSGTFNYQYTRGGSQ